jgi:hypothetical protein
MYIYLYVKKYEYKPSSSNAGIAPGPGWYTTNKSSINDDGGFKKGLPAFRDKVNLFLSLYRKRYIFNFIFRIVVIVVDYCVCTSCFHFFFYTDKKKKRGQRNVYSPLPLTLILLLL